LQTQEKSEFTAFGIHTPLGEWHGSGSHGEVSTLSKSRKDN